MRPCQKSDIGKGKVVVMCFGRTIAGGENKKRAPQEKFLCILGLICYNHDRYFSLFYFNLGGVVALNIKIVST